MQSEKENYLALALKKGLPLATLDQALIKAAKKATEETIDLKKLPDLFLFILL